MIRRNSRAILIGAASLLFIFTFWWIVSRDQNRTEASQPTFSTKYTDEYGLDALFHLLETEGMNPEKNYFRLTQADLGADDNLVVMAPLDEMIGEQRDHIMQRVEEGMNLLISVRRGDNILRKLPVSLERTAEPEEYLDGYLPLEAAGPHPILDGVQSLVYLPRENDALSAGAIGDGISRQFSGSLSDDFGYYFRSDSVNLVPVLEANGEVHVAYLNHGRGRIYLVSHPYIFTNDGIKYADNAVLVMNLFRRMLRDNEGRLVFDEYHQGFPLDRLSTPLNEPEIRIMAWALFIVFLLAVWSLSRKVGRPVPPAEEPRRNLGEFISSVAYLYYQQGDQTLMYREIVTRFLHRLKNIFGIPQSEALKVTPDLLRLATQKWNAEEADALGRLLTRLYQVPKDDKERTLEIVREIRKFSLRNKLDPYGNG